MKSVIKKIYFLLALLAVSVASCTKEGRSPETAGDEDTDKKVKVVFSIREAQAFSKSDIFDNLSDVSELYVWAYDCASGMLDCSKKFSGPSLLDKSASMELTLGHKYSFFALANLRPDRTPDSFSKALAYKMSIESYDVFDGYCPMSALVRDKLIEAVTDIELPMTRLLSQYVVLLHKDGLQGSFEPASVRIMQAAADISPFANSSMATKVMDGDCATAQELQNLGNGRPINLYMLENARGVLAKGNTDPWAKTPARESQRGLCTYLEISGKYSSPLYNTDKLTLRMFLGQNNTDNFDVLRNSTVALHVYLSDTGAAEGIFDNYWRVDPGEYDVVGNLIFARNYAMCVKCADGALLFDKRGNRVYSLSDTVSINRPYQSIEYELSYDASEMAASGLKYSVSGSSLLLSSSTASPAAGQVAMMLESSNEKLRDSLTVLTEPIGVKIAFDTALRSLVCSLEKESPVPLTLRFDTEVLMDIRCVCHKDGTMFDPQICDYQLKGSKSRTVTMGVDPKPFDGGVADEEMHYAYSTTQWDSYNLIGHANIYYHHYHPVNCRISIKCSVVEPSGLSGKLVLKLGSSYFENIGDSYVDDKDGWRCLYGGPNLMYFYHPQDEISYGFGVQEIFNGFEFNDNTYHADSMSVQI